MIAIIDYDAGNLGSVEKALQYLGETPVITRDREEILRADKVILPGVGAFGDAMRLLTQYELPETIRQAVQREIPLLGICLGQQLLFEESEESPGVKGLGILPGKIFRIPPGPGLKIPHMGWNSLTINPKSRLFAGIEQGGVCVFCPLLLSESRGCGHRGCLHGIRSSHPRCGRAGQSVCLPVPPGKEREHRTCNSEKFPRYKIGAVLC